MGRQRFIRLFAGPKSGRSQDASLRYGGRAWLIVMLSITTYTLSSPSSRSQDSATQGNEVVPEQQQVFNNACRSCHTIREGDNRLGPNLHKIVGRKAGSLPDYNYSTAMKGAGFDWDEQKLERFIENPEEVVPGNNMKPYGGLASADERKKVVAFLRSITTGPP
jgi:cytochrome c